MLHIAGRTLHRVRDTIVFSERDTDGEERAEE